MHQFKKASDNEYLQDIYLASVPLATRRRVLEAARRNGWTEITYATLEACKTLLAAAKQVISNMLREGQVLGLQELDLFRSKLETLVSREIIRRYESQKQASSEASSKENVG